MALNKNEQTVLDQINKKLSESKVLNGGFDKLVITVEQIKEKQESQIEKFDNLTTSLYEPTTGLFSRVQATEYDVVAYNNLLTGHFKQDKESLEKIDEDLAEISHQQQEMKESVDTTKRLRRLAGEDLAELTDVLSLRRNLSKIFWSIASLGVVTLLKLLYDLSKQS